MAIKKIGHIVNTFGIKGMVKISVSSSTPESRFAIGKKVIIKNQLNEDQTYTIKSVIQKNARIVYVGLDDFNDINQIEWMKERDVFANVRPPKDSFFFDELVNMTVIDHEGNELGIVDNVVTMPASDYLQVKGKLVPFKLELFIESVDKKTKKITLTELGTETFNS
ncbi:MAG: ribosome maturation factor RimM [Bacilli bacterium]